VFLLALVVWWLLPMIPQDQSYDLGDRVVRLRQAR